MDFAFVFFKKYIKIIPSSKKSLLDLARSELRTGVRKADFPHNAPFRGERPDRGVLLEAISIRTVPKKSPVALMRRGNVTVRHQTLNRDISASSASIISLFLPLMSFTWCTAVFI